MPQGGRRRKNQFMRLFKAVGGGAVEAQRLAVGVGSGDAGIRQAKRHRPRAMAVWVETAAEGGVGEGVCDVERPVV